MMLRNPSLAKFSAKGAKPCDLKDLKKEIKKVKKDHAKEAKKLAKETSKMAKQAQKEASKTFSKTAPKGFMPSASNLPAKTHPT